MPKEYATSEPVLRTQCGLGESPVWDSRTQRLYFVDIVKHRVWTYEPATGTHGYETFEEPINCISLRQEHEGLVGTGLSTFVLLTADDLPFPPTSSDTPRPVRHLTKGFPPDLIDHTDRFNDGACDPGGNFYAGTMGKDTTYHDGTLFRLDALPAGERLENAIIGSDQERQAGESLAMTRVIDGVTCCNGLGWTRDGKKMYFTDSLIGTIVTYEYDVEEKALRRRRVFSTTTSPYGAPDGLCLDSEDGVWSARWQAGALYHYSANGELLATIHFNAAFNITSCIFGGPTLEDLYVTTASSAISGHDVALHPEGGDLYCIKGLGVKGVERGRFLG